MTEDPALAKIINWVAAGFVGVAFWIFKRDKDRLDQVLNRVTVLEATAVTEDKVRQIVREENKDLKEAVHEIKNIVQNIRVNQAKRSTD